MQQISHQSPRIRLRLDKLFFTLILLVGFLIWVYPVFLALITSVKTDAQVIQDPIGLPTTISFTAFQKVWELLDFGLLLRNSLIYSLGGSLLAILFALFPAFALSRFRFPGSNLLFVILLTGMMVPQQTVVIPLYELLAKMDLLNKPVGLVLIHGVYGMPFVLLILRGYMVNIPVELESAARVDGCNDFGIMRHVIFPLSAPAIMIALTLNVINIWRELFFALIFLNNSEHYPLTVGLIKVSQGLYFSSWNIPAAAVLMAQLPTVILYIFAYRWIQRGMMAGAVKG